MVMEIETPKKLKKRIAELNGELIGLQQELPRAESHLAHVKERLTQLPEEIRLAHSTLKTVISGEAHRNKEEKKKAQRVKLQRQIAKLKGELARA